MKYFKGIASANSVGTENIWKFMAIDEQDALNFFTDTAISYIESYDDPITFEKENGIEYEYDYHVEEISFQEYEQLEVEILS